MNDFFKPKLIDERREALQKSIEEGNEKTKECYRMLFNQLNEPYKSQAKDNFDIQNKNVINLHNVIKFRVNTLSEALVEGFFWDETPQKYDYWEDVFHDCYYKENSSNFNEFLEKKKIELLSYERDWDPIEEIPISERQIDMYFNFLKNHCSSNKFLTIKLYPDESIAISWECRSTLLHEYKSLYIRCNKNCFVYVGEDTHNFIKIKGKGSYNRINTEIKEFIKNNFKVSK